MTHALLGGRLSPRGRSVLEWCAVGLLFAAVGLWYAGPSFSARFSGAVPTSALGGGSAYMNPGDQFEQFYRHNLPYYNIPRGHRPYFSGYEYRLAPRMEFSEGWIFFPFSAICSALAVPFGPVRAYNLLAILSFAFCAWAGYLLGRTASGGSRAAGLVSAAVVALNPFRVGFLFGEMVIGTDTALIPLALYAFARFLDDRSVRSTAAFFLFLFLLATSNFALLYWMALILAPFFAVGGVLALPTLPEDRRRRAALVVVALAGCVATAAYMIYVKRLLDASGLHAGQAIEEVRFYSPKPKHLLRTFGDHEQRIYLGGAAVVAALGTLAVFARRLRGATRGSQWLLVTAAVGFPLSYALAMGFGFDDATGIPFYRLVFEHVPGANGSRTPGRLMPIVAVLASVLVAAAFGALSRRLSPRARGGLALLAVCGIALDYHFSAATMTVLEPRNAAYAAFSGRRDTGLAIPFRMEGAHYENATFQYYALIHGLYLANGHSSIHPREWNEFAAEAEPLNGGLASRPVLRALRRRGIGYLVVHAGDVDPRVSELVVLLLRNNPALRERAHQRGIVSFEIVDPDRAPDSFGSDAFLAAAEVLTRAHGRRRPGGSAAVELVTGWYGREAYEGQRPFRWMEGTSSILLVSPSGRPRTDDVAFEYKCPIGGLSVDGRGVEARSEPGSAPEWTRVVLDVPDGVESVVTLGTPQVFRVPTDARSFGCMVTDFEVR